MKKNSKVVTGDFQYSSQCSPVKQEVQARKLSVIKYSSEKL